MNEQTVARLDNLRAIKIAAKQSVDYASGPMTQGWNKARDVEKPTLPKFFGWYGIETPEMRNSRSWGVPTVADQLEVLQNCVIVAHGRILQATSQTSELSNPVKSKNKVLKAPDLLENMRANINICPEIEELSIEDGQFNYVLNNILNIIGEQLEHTERRYKIEVKLETDLCNPLDRHSNIIIRLKENNYRYILDIWDEIGHEIGKYLESLKEGVMTSGDVDKLYDLINVIFTPDAT